jgi:hypothetical protein
MTEYLIILLVAGAPPMLAITVGIFIIKSAQRELHKQLNQRLSELVEEARRSAGAEGREIGRVAEVERQRLEIPLTDKFAK